MSTDTDRPLTAAERAAAAAINREMWAAVDGCSDETLARAALEAAAPFLVEHLQSQPEPDDGALFPAPDQTPQGGPQL